MLSHHFLSTKAWTPPWPRPNLGLNTGSGRLRLLQKKTAWAEKARDKAKDEA